MFANVAVGVRFLLCTFMKTCVQHFSNLQATCHRLSNQDEKERSFHVAKQWKWIAWNFTIPHSSRCIILRIKTFFFILKQTHINTCTQTQAAQKCGGTFEAALKFKANYALFWQNFLGMFFGTELHTVYPPITWCSRQFKVCSAVWRHAEGRTVYFHMSRTQNPLQTPYRYLCKPTFSFWRLPAVDFPPCSRLQLVYLPSWRSLVKFFQGYYDFVISVYECFFPICGEAKYLTSRKGFWKSICIRFMDPFYCLNQVSLKLPSTQVLPLGNVHARVTLLLQATLEGDCLAAK